jgi:prepilin-type N-terminal cleavage/methylation domain-containing protein
MNTKHKRQSKGFTLIEAMFAVMLIGLVIAAIAVSSGASTMVNGVSIDLSTAEFLIEELREMTTTMTFDALDTYTETNINPPIDINGDAMAEFSDFTQLVDIVHVLANDLQTVDGSDTSDFLRITITITKNNSPISSASWIRARL